MVPRETLYVSSPNDTPLTGGEVALEGTVGTPVKSDEFKFESAPDSNVVVEVTRQTDTPRITVGVYYV